MDQEIKICYYCSPIGRIAIGCSDQFVRFITFENTNEEESSNASKNSSLLYGCVESTTHLHQLVIHQLDQYFRSERTVFELPIQTLGSTYQVKVWEQLLSIPYGTTISYKGLAKAVVSDRHCRAVANANRMNPIAIVVPCHRVIQSDGKLGGYAGEVWRKEWLLFHESKNNHNKQI